MPMQQHRTPYDRHNRQKRINNFKNLINKASLEQLNSDNYKQKFNAFCLELGAEKAEELTKLHNDRMLSLAQSEGANNA